MKTNFTPDQMANPFIRMMEENLRKCVHCGFCLPSCPTYSVLGDERKSPRGRIYLIKDLLENNTAINTEIVDYIDSCLSCLACKSACPSGVNYQHYIDYARNHIEKNHRRPWYDRWIRILLVQIIQNHKLFKIGLRLAKIAKPLFGLFGQRISKFFDIVPAELKAGSIPDGPKVFLAEGTKIKRVALLTGCAQKALRPSINEATIRLLTRMGMEVVVSNGTGCCGALSHHLGKDSMTRKLARGNIDSWQEEFDQDGLDAIIINAAGCGTEVKDYAYMFEDDPEYREKAKRISDLAKDITEIIEEHQLPLVTLRNPPDVVYHDACSLMHGQGITQLPRDQLRATGFNVLEIPGRYFCCGSAGSYNLLMPTMASELKERRQTSIKDIFKSSKASILVTGNIGCLIQLANGIEEQVVHTVELLDWATGGLKPPS